MIELARISPDLASDLAPGFTVADFRETPAAQPLPLALCWTIWFAASAGLWMFALRAASWLY